MPFGTLVQDAGSGDLIVLPSVPPTPPPSPAPPPPIIEPAPPPPSPSPVQPPDADITPVLGAPALVSLEAQRLLGPVTIVDTGAATVAVPAATGPTEIQPVGAPVQPPEAPPAPVVPDDLTEAQTAAEANTPALGGLPGFEVDNPFAVRILAVEHPPLKGAAAATAINDACTVYDIDPDACLANALHEGAGGGIGDHGNAYGPWQIHLTDGRLAEFAGKAPYDLTVNAWAWTQNGIEYAVRQMALSSPSAKGLTGHAAVYAIVYGFELPADKAGAYRTRAAEYDHLQKLDQGAFAYVSSQLLGPADGGAVGAVPSGGGAAVKAPPGFQQTWRDLIDVYAVKVPAHREKVRAMRDVLIGTMR